MIDAATQVKILNLQEQKQQELKAKKLQSFSSIK